MKDVIRVLFHYAIIPSPRSYVHGTCIRGLYETFPGYVVAGMCVMQKFISLVHTVSIVAPSSLAVQSHGL